MTQKIIRVGLDLDGVIINKPPAIPKSVIEWLIQSHTNHQKKYRFPKTKLEQWVRIKSHHWKLRRPLNQNLKMVQNLAKSKKHDIYFVSSRFSFLKQQTKNWFEHYFPKFNYKKVYINLKDQQPHLFKEEMIKKLKLDCYLEDDPRTISYLKSKSRCLIIRVFQDEDINLFLDNLKKASPSLKQNTA
ncbi:MAG: hypothetical protein ABIB61_03815 [Candidatus Shapirobacteria bacterium]